MFDKFLKLDEFITPALLTPFYLASVGLAALFALFGALTGLGVMFVSPIAGITSIIVSLGGGILSIIGIRMGFEAFLAIMRLHTRFVGGHPRDRVPD
jgi:hypothetical protein